MTGLLARLVALTTWGIARVVAAGLVVLVRLLLGLLRLVGLRGPRLAWLVATLAGVAWAAPHVGLRPALALATLGWLVWLLRRPGAPRRERAALRRPGAPPSQRVALRRLAVALEAHTRALPSNAAHRTTHASVLASAPTLTASQRTDQAWRELERHAAWTRHHTQPTPVSDGEGR